jgi:hypothetical protein
LQARDRYKLLFCNAQTRINRNTVKWLASNANAFVGFPAHDIRNREAAVGQGI